MRWLRRSAFVAASLGATAAVAFADPANLLPPLEPLPPTGGSLGVLPPADPAPAAHAGPQIVVLKSGNPPPDVAVPKPSTPLALAAPLPASPGRAYPLPAIPSLPNGGAPAAPLEAVQPPPNTPAPTSQTAPLFTSPFLSPAVPAPVVKVPPAAPAPVAKVPASVVKGPPVEPVPSAQPGKLPAFPETASSGAKPASPAPTPPTAPASTAPAALASAPCGGGPCQTASDPGWHLFPREGRVRAYGWLDGGYVYNTSNPASKFNGPYNSADRSAEPMFNQAYGVLERALPTGGAWGVGGRVDVLAGYDFLLGQSRGLEANRDGGRTWNGEYYGVALPQAYIEGGNEIGALKLGHFYAPVGYESLASANNFFYSHAYSFQFGQPITLWGGLVTTQVTRNLQVQAGAVNGWNTLVGRDNAANFVGSLKWTADSEKWWSSFALVSGENPNNVAGLPLVPDAPANRTRYSFLLGLLPGGPCGNWEYVFHHFYGWQESGTPQGSLARWYGIDQYLYYRVSNKWRVGARFEWFRDEDGTRVGLNRATNPNNPPLPGNYFSLTSGVNYSPTANVLVRPEVRWDFTSDTARPAFSDGRKSNQLLLGCDVILKY